MEQAKTLERGSKTHPILITAGVAVLLFSLLGAAALTGIPPTATPKAGDAAVAHSRAVGDRVRIVDGKSIERA